MPFNKTLLLCSVILCSACGGGSSSSSGSGRSVDDTDGDGLYDSVEVALSTNPNSKDSDNDGVDDNVELAYGLDPNDPDSANPHDLFATDFLYITQEGIIFSFAVWGGVDDDADHLMAQLETIFGTDDTNEDTDNDGAIDGFEVLMGTDPMLGTSTPSELAGQENYHGGYYVATGSDTGTCTDSIKNGNETGVDCGNRCAACGNNNDGTCNDQTQNGNETGVDCGGRCDACNAGLMLFVDDANDMGLNCLTWATACKSLAAALPKADDFHQQSGNADKIVRILMRAHQTYKPVGTFNVKSKTYLYGGCVGTEASGDDCSRTERTILSGDLSGDDDDWTPGADLIDNSLPITPSLFDDNAQNIVTVAGRDVYMQGLKITRGRGDGNGKAAAINVNILGNVTTEGPVVLASSEIRENYTGYGGAVDVTSDIVHDEDLVFYDVQFRYNVTNSQGSVMRGPSTLKLHNYFLNCKFEFNEARLGGGALSTSSDTTIINSVFYRNFAWSYAARNVTGNDRTGIGGAIYMEKNGRVTLVNSVLVQNSAGKMGGAIGIFSGPRPDPIGNYVLGTNGLTIYNTAILNNGGHYQGCYKPTDRTSNCVSDVTLPLSAETKDVGYFYNATDWVSSSNVYHADIFDIQHSCIRNLKAGSFNDRISFASGSWDDHVSNTGETCDITNTGGYDGLANATQTTGEYAYNGGSSDLVPNDVWQLTGNDANAKISKDLNGHTRIRGSAVDIGPFEVQQD